jgi:hypothetical protein
MKTVKWVAIGVVILVLGGFLHWTLPSRDIVRIVGTDVVRVDADSGSTSGAGEAGTRDLRLINTVTPSGEPRVFRNEDTGWGWPPYFKFDSSNLAAEADNAVSTKEAPEWMIVTHYGWRITFLSRYPNAVSIRPAEGPEQTLIPWFNIVILAVLAALVLVARRQVLRLFGA